MPHPLDKSYLQDIARLVESKLPDNHGFILLTAPFGLPADPQRPHYVAYVSNCDRKEAIAMLKEWLIKASGEEEWMKHIR